MPKYKLCLLDIDYVLNEKKEPVIRIFGKTDKGKSIVALDSSFKPYFYVLTQDLNAAEKKIKDLEGEFEIREIKRKKKGYKGKEHEFLVVYTRAPGEVPAAREMVRALPEVKEVLEADILFVRRYLLDRGLVPMGMISVEGKETKADLDADIIVEIKGKPENIEEEIPKLNVASFDIEVYSPGRLGQAGKDPIMMVSVATDNKKKIFSYKEGPSYVEKLENETAMLKAFEEFVRKNDIDVLTAYNSDNFDMPYLRDRLHILKEKFKLGRDRREVQFKSRGRYHAAQVRGRVHVDLYHYVNIILRGALQQVSKKTLKSVAAEFLEKGLDKKEIDWLEVEKYWENKEKRKELFEYSANDAVITKKLADIFLPREYEIAKLVRLPLFDSARTTYGQLVEVYLMWNAYERNEVVPNRPVDAEREARAAFEAFEGAYVKEPEKGMYEKVALFDFRSLYPTIIISHNIDVGTIDCDCCRGKAEKVADTEHWFCKKKTGLMPDVLKKVLEERIKTKGEMKKARKGSEDYMILDNRQYALKILANSAYGYLAYRGSRWYTREGASSVTALGRMYIQKIIKIAEEFGLKAIYGDTDSLFVVAEDGKIKDKTGKFLKKVNSELPGVMELEFEGVFKRAVFVSKKRYAMIDKENNLKIKGLEFVRRDWSPIAKETQRKVLETLLKDGSPEKAFQIVREVVKKIKDRKISIDELAVYTDLTRPLDKYEVTAPHIAVAKILKKRGEDIQTGSTIGYVIVKGTGKKISDRARPVGEVDVDKYDITYYIEHQILPAVSRVMEALGYGEDELMGKKQGKLGDYFK